MKTVSFNAWRREKEIEAFSEWLESNGYNPKHYDLNQLIDEGVWDTAKKWGRNAVVAGTLAGAGMGMFGGQGQSHGGQPQAQPMNAQAIKQAFDNNTLTAQQWKQLAPQYTGDYLGFVPDPAKPGSWVAAGGPNAAVRVQSFTNVDKDELKQDTIGLTPYKDGKAMRQTDWSDGTPRIPGEPSKGRVTTTPMDGPGLWQQAMQMRNTK
jgi:hypothetical protein